MRIRFAMILGSAALFASSSSAPAGDETRTARIAELARLKGVPQMIQNSADRDDAVQAWGRFYLQGLTDQELDAILAFYRSAAGQKDLLASQAALPQLQQYLLDKRTHAMAAHQETATPGKKNSTQPVSTGGPLLGSNPSAPDGKVVPNSVADHCEPAASPATRARGVPATGRSVVCVCVDEKGKLTGDPVIAESSGDPKTDSGAVKVARLDSGRYGPPTVQGHPQEACFRVAINFGRAE
jgi:Uncharacterized protein conserved in bacteria (DUF2059)